MICPYIKTLCKEECLGNYNPNYSYCKNYMDITTNLISFMRNESKLVLKLLSNCIEGGVK